MRHSLLFILVSLLAACSRPGTLAYVPAAPPAPGISGSVSAVIVHDSRDEKPNRLATIRGGYGNPLKVLDTPIPVANVVAAIWTDALKRRQMFAPSGPFRFQVDLKTLYGDQLLGRKAEIQMELAVYDRAANVVYRDAIGDITYEPSFFASGVFADIDDLRIAVESLLSKSIDQMLAKPALSNALSGSRPVTAPAS